MKKKFPRFNMMRRLGTYPNGSVEVAISGEVLIDWWSKENRFRPILILPSSREARLLAKRILQATGNGRKKP